MRPGSAATGDAKKYRQKAGEAYDGSCDRCGEETDWEDIEVHHVDRDRSNDSDDNLECLCLSCHNEEHGGGSPLWGVMVEVPKPVLDLVDHLVEERGYATRHEAFNRAVVAFAKPEDVDAVSGFSSPDDAVTAWFADERHALWTRDREVGP